jgi:hypothetical protein
MRIPIACAAIVLALPTGAWAHERNIDLHVGTAYESCYFDLHPELTEAEFQEWAAEAGQILRSRQMSSAETLGAGNFEVGLGYSYFFLDDSKGAWNNTMSHPADDHYLGEELGTPYLELKLGVSDDVDAEVFGIVNWQANYGFVGVASKIRLLDETEGKLMSLSVRPSASALLGPSEVQAYNLSGDVAVSRNFHGFSPFAGVTLSTTLAVESSDDTDVGNQAAARTLAFAGLEYRWKFISAAAQAEVSDLTAFALHVGGRF